MTPYVDVPAAPWSLEDEMLKNLRIWVLEQCRGNRLQAAEVLGCSAGTINKAIARYKKAGFVIPPPRQNRYRQALPPSFWQELHNKVVFKGD